MSQSVNCFVCGRPASVTSLETDVLNEWKCSTCGEFSHWPLVIRSRPCEMNQAHKLSAAIRLQNRAGIKPQITQSFVDSALREPDKSISEKSRLTLEFIESRTSYLSEQLVIYRTDFPLTYSKNDDEFWSLLLFHDQEKNIFIDSSNSTLANLSLTFKGFETLEALRRSRPDAETAFVAMSFDDSLDRVYFDQIQPAILDAGFVPRRIDLVPHNDDILAKILTEIRMAKFVVADFTQHKNGVYFEAGFAKGLGLEVVWLCREDDINKAHFDTNHFNHLKWNDSGDLRENLAARILLTIGPGPHYKSPTA